MWGSVFGALAALSLMAEQQSLGEVARKERERRAGLSREKPSEVIGEEDLESAQGASLSISGTESRDLGAREPEARAERLTDKEVRELRQEWSRIWKEQMDQARRELEKAEDDVYQCRSASLFVYVPLAVDCEGVGLRLAFAEARMKEVERSRYNWETLLPGNAASR